MSTEKIITAIDERGIATITLNNPDKHNAFDDEIIAQLTNILLSLNTNATVRVVILKANGNSFSAGADLNWMKRMANYSYEENLIDGKKLALMLHTLYSLTKPTIARVQGATLGGGVGLVCCCDMAIASEHASFSLSEVKLGMVPSTISPYVIEAIGPRFARRYFMTAERFNAGIALHLGLINECVAAEQLDATIAAITNAILANGPQAVTAAKQLVHDVQYKPIDQSLLQHTSELIATMRSSAEGKEGLSAFLEKRQPNWINAESAGE